ncbi:MAG: glycoside hydrolase family 27 protein [Gammaproteobacteria bacterium]|nr:glycoside hydrolase family 27 protein [Gammaproteobacteria bacterium]
MLLASGLALATTATSHSPAPTPPMGWNSWDAYGLTIDQAEFKANAAKLAKFKQYGWRYAVIDEGWYMGKPLGDKLATRDYQVDSHGLLIPDPKRYPLSIGGAGFKPLADWVHGHGLKFGLHIVRGIPKQAVEADLPIAGSAFRARQAANTADTCGWDDGNYGVRDNAAGQAYYDSMLRLYARWGVDFIKVDCIADHPFRPTEIREIALAIRKTGRSIVLSLSPGPTQLSHAAFVARHAQMWRISNDIWDAWSFKNHTPDGFPSGVVTAFDHLAEWNPHVTAGAWPDADMLPFGSLTPHPGMGEPRMSRLSHDEERTQITLWVIARSPLILGANLTKLDAFTRSLMTNKDVIAVDQTAWNSHPLAALPAGFAHARVWEALAGSRRKPVRYLAFFNLADTARTLNAAWSNLGLPPGNHAAVELWTGANRPASDQITIALPAHGSAIYRID